MYGRNRFRPDVGKERDEDFEDEYDVENNDDDGDDDEDEDDDDDEEGNNICGRFCSICCWPFKSVLSCGLVCIAGIVVSFQRLFGSDEAKLDLMKEKLTPLGGFGVIRSAGVIASLIAAGTLCLDVVVNRYVVNVEIGAWWAALFSLLCGLLAVFSSYREIATMTIILSTLAVVGGIIACSVDGLATQITLTLNACVSGPSGPHVDSNTIKFNSSTVTFYGPTNYHEAAYGCYVDMMSTEADCFCVGNRARPYTCYTYVGQQNCNNVLTMYKKLLIAAVSADGATLLAMIVLGCTMCGIMMLPQRMLTQDEKAEDYQRYAQSRARGADNAPGSTSASPPGSGLSNNVVMYTDNPSRKAPPHPHPHHQGGGGATATATSSGSSVAAAQSPGIGVSPSKVKTTPQPSGVQGVASMVMGGRGATVGAALLSHKGTRGAGRTTREGTEGREGRGEQGSDREYGRDGEDDGVGGSSSDRERGRAKGKGTDQEERVLRMLDEATGDRQEQGGARGGGGGGARGKGGGGVSSPRNRGRGDTSSDQGSQSDDVSVSSAASSERARRLHRAPAAGVNVLARGGGPASPKSRKGDRDRGGGVHHNTAREKTDELRGAL